MATVDISLPVGRILFEQFVRVCAIGMPDDISGALNVSRMRYTDLGLSWHWVVLVPGNPGRSGQI